MNDFVHLVGGSSPPTAQQSTSNNRTLESRSGTRFEDLLHMERTQTDLSPIAGPKIPRKHSAGKNAHPFEVVKKQVQNQEEGKPASSSTLDAARSTERRDRESETHTDGPDGLVSPDAKAGSGQAQIVQPPAAQTTANPKGSSPTAAAGPNADSSQAAPSGGAPMPLAPVTLGVLSPEAAQALESALAGQSGENVDQADGASAPQAQPDDAKPAKTTGEAEAFSLPAKLQQMPSAVAQVAAGSTNAEQQAPVQPAGAASATTSPAAAANTGKPQAQDPNQTPTPETTPVNNLAAATLEKARFVVSAQETEPARLAEARTTELVRQVTHGLETAVKNHQISMRLQLFPEDMGRIDLRLTAGAHGLGITLSAEQPATSQLLEANLGKLQQALAGAGISLSSLNIGQGQSQPTLQQGSTWQQSQRGLPGFPFQDNTPDAKWTEPIRNVNQAAAGVDYRV